MSTALTRLADVPPTCHAYPWALVRRGGQVKGQAPRTRLAYLTGTYVPRGSTKAAAMTGFFVRIDRRGQAWRATKGTVRVEWSEVVQSWRLRPDARQIARAKEKAWVEHVRLTAAPKVFVAKAEGE